MQNSEIKPFAGENDFLSPAPEKEKTEQRETYTPPTKKSRLALLLTGLGLLLLLPLGLLLYLYKDIRPVAVCEMNGSLPDLTPFSLHGAEIGYLMADGAADFSSPGTKLVNLTVNGKARLCLMRLVDTTAPAAEFNELSIGVSETLTPDKFLLNLKDAQPVAVYFAENPVFGQVGTQSVTVMMEDMSGNLGSVSGALHIQAQAEDTYTLEAGDPVPDASVFRFSEADTAKYITDVSAIDTHIPGNYEIRLDISGTECRALLQIRDTVAPEVTVKTLFIDPGKTVTAEDFILTAEDETQLTYSLVSVPDYASRDIQQVTILTKDAGGNCTESTAELLISPLEPVTLEAQDGYLRASMLGEDIKILSYLKLNQPGAYKVRCDVDGEECYQLVTVQDTVAPKVTAQDAEAYLHLETDPAVLIASAEDVTKITYAFKEKPDPESEEPQQVTVLCTDEGGNTTEVSAVLTLTPDTTPPVLYVPEVTYCYIGEAVSYFSTVAAEDERGGEVTITVDNSAVNIYAEGTYPVTYTATDPSGNSTSVTAKLTLIEPGVTQAAFDQAVNELYRKIIPEGTDIKRQAVIIYEWVYKNMTYRIRANKKDWKYEAWRGITYKNGDCFSFCAVARALLEKAGAKCLVVTREGGYAGTHHWWLLVDVGTGYYHFDPINVGPKNYKCCMRTDAEVKKKNKLFWAFDSSKYPATPTEPFSVDD